MTFTPKNWQNSPDDSTPITAEAIEDVEVRVTDYADSLSRVIDVTEYGVVAGGPDNTTAIDNALADATDGSTVLFPGGGPYVTTGGHQIPEGVAVEGTGRASSNIHHNGGSTYCFRLMDERSGGRGCGLKGLSIHGSSGSFSATAGAVGVEVSNGQQHRLDDIFIYGYTGVGSAGIVFRNRDGSTEYVEQTKGFGVAVINCTTLIEFIHDAGGGDSFGYTSLFGLQLQIYTNQTAIKVRSGCNLYNSYLQGSLHYTGNNGVGIHVASGGQIWQGTTFQMVGEVLSGTSLKRIFNEDIFHANGKFYVATLSLPGADDISGATQHSFVEDQLTFAENDTLEIASATTITIPGGSSAWNVTGTTAITGINPSWNGRIVTLKFGDSLTIGGGSMQLAGGVNFATTANDTLTLYSMSGVWREVARSVN